MRQFLKDEFIQFATQFSAHQCDPNTSISFAAIYFSLPGPIWASAQPNSHIFHPPISTFVSPLPPFLQGPAFVIPELLFFPHCFVGYAHLRSTAARFQNAASLAAGVM